MFERTGRDPRLEPSFQEDHSPVAGASAGSHDGSDADPPPDQTCRVAMLQTDLERALGMPLNEIIGTVASRLFRLCGGRKALAEDLTQETLEALIKRAKDGWCCESRAGTAYLRVAAKNHFLTAVKERRITFEPLVDYDVADASASPDQVLIDEFDLMRRESAARRAMGLVEKLKKPEHRQVVEMCVLQGLSRAEVARQLGEPESTVRSRLKSALTELKNLMKRPENPGGCA